MPSTPQLSSAAIERIAQVMHEGVRAWQNANKQDAAPPWSRAPQWMKRASCEAVTWRLSHPNAPSSAQHEQWMSEKKAAGWKHGRTKSGVKKTHPLLVPYDQLPEIERRKDALVAATIDALARPLR
ncbi:MAG TPA: RyR domain-containing protein [Hyphomonadaceae bacterium]|nr:RyR domain-containing protein [Hyphomonadaceae bacterium]